MADQSTLKTNSKFLEPFKDQFEALLAGAQAGQLALVQCKHAVDGHDIPVVCLVRKEGKEYIISPISELLSSEKLAELLPP